MDTLQLLEAMVRIPSVNPFRYFSRPNGEGYLGLGAELDMNVFVEEQLRKAGFEVTRQLLHPEERVSVDGTPIHVPARWNVLGTRYPTGKWNGKSVLFFGHTDTVDVKHGWQSDPFSITRRNVSGHERWYGLGANDMKSGLAAVLNAVAQANAQSYAIKVAFLVDEEFYSFGAECLVHSEFLSDVVLAIAPELGDTLQIGMNDEGTQQQIGIGRLGRVEYDFQVFGKACHGADAFIHPEAVNAVHEAAKLQAALVPDCASVKREFSAHGARAMNSSYISFQSGGQAMLSVPDKASFVLDRTFLPDESPETELVRLQELVGALQSERAVDPRAKITVTPRPRPTSSCQPYLCAPDHPEILRVLKAVGEHSQAHSFRIGRSVADENRVAVLGIPTLTIGPHGAGSHTNEEWVEPGSVLRIAAIFESLIRLS
jgi:acetylornithine deacetylase/succinyl-diaminopimelate desuccinylase-like protein